MKYFKVFLIYCLLSSPVYSQSEITFEKSQPLKISGNINLNDTINNNIQFKKIINNKNTNVLPLWNRTVQNRQKDYNKIETLLKNKQNVNVEIIDGHNMLILGAMQKDIEQVNLALKYKANINSTNKQGETALHWAITDNNVAYRLLQENQKNKNPKEFLNKKNKDGRTALHFACMFTPDNQVVDLLINNGADIDIRDKDGRSPAFYAAAFEQWNALETLLKRGANIELLDNNQVSSEHIILYKADVQNMIRFYPYLSIDGKKNIQHKLGQKNIIPLH